ncbi:MAG: hypothetical protein ACRD0U_10045 [Acidimicrobiales bacterium]
MTVLAADLIALPAGAGRETREAASPPDPVAIAPDQPTTTAGAITEPLTAGTDAHDLGSDPAGSPGGEAQPASLDLSITGRCDPLDPSRCLLPFPNDLFTTADPSTDTGRRVALDLLSMPRNLLGKPVDPTEWNRNDGFSPGSMVLTFVPGLDLHATWDSPLDHIQDLSWYTRPDAPIAIIDADTGARHPFWSELDSHPDAAKSDRLLILRPAVNFEEGHRYVVALRNLRGAGGSSIPAGPAFAAYRDGTPGPPDPAFEPRRRHMERLFGELAHAGIGRDELYLAWDFTVASERNLTERALRIRDDAFARLGDTDLADGQLAGSAPRYRITRVHDVADGPTMRRVEGTITVPNYLTPQIEVGANLPVVQDAVAALPGPVTDLLNQLTGPLPIGVDDLVNNSLSVPGSRFWTLGSPDGLPVVDPLQPTVDVPFVCSIARGSDATPSHPLLYGHGLLGSRNESPGSSTTALRERGFSPCAVDWWGMSFADLPNVATILLDVSNMATLADRSQQGFLNFLYLGRALAHPAGLAAAPAFQAGDGRSLIRTGELYYNGNSQGGILGGALTALAPDLTRSVLGVPAMNYSTLLNRSVDWEGEYGAIFNLTYPDQADRQIVFSLIQMLWDRAEANGYAHHMTSDPLAGTPPHEVMLQVAFADHQVANVAAEVEGRTIGARLRVPAVPDGLHWSVDPAFGFSTVPGGSTEPGSVLVYWYSEGKGLGTPPNGNLPMTQGRDPHGDARKYGPAADQAAHFLLTGQLIDTCGGGPCVIPAGG